MSFYPPPGTGSIEIKDEGVTIAASATSLDFTGSGVTATAVGSDVTANIPGGGGGGGVTSVDATVPTGLSVSGVPITTSGTIAISLAAGYVIPLQTTLDGYVTTDQTVPQTIGATGARLTKLWATDLTVTNAISGSVTGNAGTVTGLSVAGGKTLTASNTLTFTGTDGSSVAFGAGGTVLYTTSTVPLTVGTTTIASGTTTRVLFDNAGVLGEYAISGTGNVAMTTSPVFTTPNIGNATGNISGNAATVTTNANLTGDVTSVGNATTLVGGTSPSFTTSIVTASTTFSLVNATATTVNFAGAATTLNVGGSATVLNFGGGATAAEFRFLEPSGSGSNYSAFKAVAQGANITYSLPAAVGAAGSVLTDAAGNGVLSWASGGSSNPAAVLGGIPLTGMKFVNAFGSNLSTGDNDVYTCPANKRAYVTQGVAYNQSAGTINFYAELKSGGSYYRLMNTAAPAAGAMSNIAGSGVSIVLEAGESISVNVATTNGLNVWFRVVEFDSTVKFYTSKLKTLSSGDNTLYTCPANTAARIVQGLADTGTASFLYSNASGGSRTVYWNKVPSGGSPGNTNRVSAGISVSDGAVDVTAMYAGCLGAGDFVNVNTSAATATQMAWVNVVEYPA